MRYIHIDLEAGIKESSEQQSNFREEQHHFQDENGKNGGIIAKQERRGCVGLIKDGNNERNNCTPPVDSARVSIV